MLNKNWTLEKAAEISNNRMNRKIKGNHFERQVAKYLSKASGKECFRNIPLARNSERGDILGLGFLIECKNWKDTAKGLAAGYKQTKDSLENKDDYFFIIAKQPRKSIEKSIVVFPATYPSKIKNLNYQPNKAKTFRQAINYLQNLQHLGQDESWLKLNSHRLNGTRIDNAGITLLENIKGLLNLNNKNYLGLW